GAAGEEKRESQQDDPGQQTEGQAQDEAPASASSGGRVKASAGNRRALPFLDRCFGRVSFERPHQIVGRTAFIGVSHIVQACIFTLPNQRMGPAATDLFQVERMTELVFAIGGMERRYPKAGGCKTTQIKSGGELLGARLLRGNDTPVNLAAVPEALAVAVDDG